MNRRAHSRNPTLGSIERKLVIMSQELDHLTKSVADLKTVAQSAEALLSGLSAQLRDALAKPDPSAAISAIADDIDADKAELAAAVAANTAAAPPPPPVA